MPNLQSDIISAFDYNKTKLSNSSVQLPVCAGSNNGIISMSYVVAILSLVLVRETK